MKKSLLLLSAIFLHFAASAQTSLNWSSFTDSTVSYSSPRATDLNGDGVKDIVMGAGKEAAQTNYGLLAIDGANGNSLWNMPTPNELFTSPAFKDITGDNVDDIFIGGRGAQLYAVNGATGNIIWKFWNQVNSPTDSGFYNFYSAQFIPDMNADMMPDLLVANGGDHAAPVWQTNRPPAHMMVIDAMTGAVLAKAVVPDSAETYCSPVVADLKGNGTLYIIFGTGGETLGGSLYVAELVNDLMNNDLSAAIPLVTHPTKGFIAPPAVANYANDGNLDIIAQGYDGTVYRFYSGNFSLKWSKAFPGTESSAGPVLGNFTGNLTPDIFCVLYKGVAPSFTDYYQVMLDGTNGNVIRKDSTGYMHFVSANAFDSNGDGRDEVLISVNDHVGHFRHQLRLIDFQNNTLSNFWNSEGGSNIGCTPFIGDLDADHQLDIVYAYRADSTNPMGWKGLKVKRLNTGMNIPIAGIAWGSYMGTAYDGHYTYNVNDCGTGSILSGSLNQNPSCNGFADGKIVPYTNNGTPPFTYLWSNGSVNDTLLNAGAGTYTLTVTDSTGCLQTATATLSDPFVIGFGGVLHNTCPGGTAGQATVTSSGCVCMFSGCTFLWDNGQTAYTATGLSAGTHSVTITHLNGCVVNTSIVINDGLPAIDSVAPTDVSCNGMNDGSILAIATNTATANYYWNGVNGTSLHNNLAPGTYTLVINDGRPCPDTTTVIITEPGALGISMSATSESGVGMNDGTATAVINGGTPPYTYAWNDPGSQTTNPATGLATGIYIVTATDANGCVIIDSVLVDITTGISVTESNDNATIFPNPAKDFMLLNFQKPAAALSVEVLDAGGRLIKNYASVAGNQLRIDRGNMSNGIYFLKIRSGSHVLKQIKFVWVD